VRAALAAAAGFALMEPATYATHRWLMHGPGLALHRSHHAPPDRRGRRFVAERNDWFPVMFGSGVVTAMAVGFNVPGCGVLVPIGVGVTLYGAAYALVHDVYTHQRLGALLGRWRPLEVLAERHRRHHATGGEPYGMLVPVLSRRHEASGSMPSHVPVEP
jgi:beta-carotene 3-hydroxylase